MAPVHQPVELRAAPMRPETDISSNGFGDSAIGFDRKRHGSTTFEIRHRRPTDLRPSGDVRLPEAQLDPNSPERVAYRDAIHEDDDRIEALRVTYPSMTRHLPFEAAGGT